MPLRNSKRIIGLGAKIKIKCIGQVIITKASREYCPKLNGRRDDVQHIDWP